jgi:hypothetical protein
MSSFIDSLEEPDKTELKKYQNIILRSDSKVVEKHTKIMSVENSLTYEEEGVFKYGLTKTKNHYSFHSMVMYSNADVLEYIKKYVKKGAKVQKGCVNFKNTSQLPIEIFQEIMLLSAKKDFSPVIEHYKKKI